MGVRGKFDIFPLKAINLSIYFFSLLERNAIVAFLFKWECTNYICFSFYSTLNNLHNYDKAWEFDKGYSFEY